MKTPTVLIIMDGYGLSDETYGNAIAAADTPVLDGLFLTCPHTELHASGLEVGLPAGQMGNSEVGHTNIGAGRVVFQDLPRISQAIATGAFFENPAYKDVMEYCVRTGNSLHLCGLLSNGGVHSTLEHLYALLEMAKHIQVPKVYIHAFLDGRDVAPTSGKDFLAQCMDKCAQLGVGRIATVTGRYYAMDRDKRWERLQRAYDAMVCLEGTFSRDPVQAVQDSYDRGVTDEFVEPIVCTESGAVTEGDGIIFFNFRPDRARELTRCFVDPDFDNINRRFGCFPVRFVCTTQYDESMPNVNVAFRPHTLTNILGDYLSRLGLTQLRIAETEKYAHVTFFFNGGMEEAMEGEDRVLIPSPQVATYDMQPEMSAYQVAQEAVARIREGKYDLVVLNFANCDMVGHTGVFDAAVQAVEAVDDCVGQVCDAVRDMGGISIVTADHGNAECMLTPDGNPVTSHTTNLVPFLICGIQARLRDGGCLADIAPTILDIMGLNKPEEMTGQSLILG